MKFPGSNHQVPLGLYGAWAAVANPTIHSIHPERFPDLVEGGAIPLHNRLLKSRRDFLTLAREFIPARLLMRHALDSQIAPQHRGVGSFQDA